MEKVTVERDVCIGCGACWGTCPEVFEQNKDDGLSQIVTDLQIDGEIGEGRMEETLEECVRQAADGCPVSAIILE
ncbi:MAG: ferredoxin [Acidaminococcaceae bacterium]